MWKAVWAHVSAMVVSFVMVGLIALPLQAQDLDPGGAEAGPTSAFGLQLDLPDLTPSVEPSSWLPSLANMHPAPRRASAKKLDPDNPGHLILGVLGGFAVLALLWCVGIFQIGSPNTGSCFE